MHMLRHDNKLMKLKPPFAPIAIDRLQQELGV